MATDSILGSLRIHNAHDIDKRIFEMVTIKMFVGKAGFRVANRAGFRVANRADGRVSQMVDQKKGVEKDVLLVGSCRLHNIY